MTTFARLADGALDMFLPRRCVQCGRAGAWLCEACAPALVPLPPGVCRRCGAPLPAVRDDCDECRGRDLAFVSARAAFVYVGPARRLVTACKFRSLKSLVTEMADLAAAPFAEAVAGVAPGARGQGVDLVTCVPVHRDRDLERGFDQAALLGRRLAEVAGLPFAPLLVRARKGRRQSGLGAAERAANVRDAFRFNENWADKEGRVRTVVVVDDVYTTGETLHQCCRVLRHAGCEPYAFTFARAARAFRSTARAQRPKEPR